MNDRLTRFTADRILGVTWVIAWAHILYADELPGDGFTAGVFVLVTVLLQFVVLGRRHAAELLPPRVFHAVASVGVLVIVVLVTLPLTWGGAPLEHFEIPLGVGTLSSTTLFDLAIFSAVSGALVVGFTSLEEPEA